VDFPPWHPLDCVDAKTKVSLKHKQSQEQLFWLGCDAIKRYTSESVLWETKKCVSPVFCWERRRCNHTPLSWDFPTQHNRDLSRDWKVGFGGVKSIPTHLGWCIGTFKKSIKTVRYLKFGMPHLLGRHGDWKWAAVFILVGQALSTALYLKIGGEGITYGIERGKLPDQKATGFPFCIPHPQYVGVVLTCIGFMFLWGFNKDRKPIEPILSYFVIIIFLFVLNGWVESFPACSHQCASA
jgi:hypothetical protein